MARKGSTQLPEFVADPATTPPAEADLLEQLAFEHRQIERLWSELQLAHLRQIEAEHRPDAGYGSGGQHELSRRIVTILTEHEALELELLYPTVGQVVGEELAYHSRADHEEVRQLLDRVDGEDPTEETVFQAFTSIMRKVMAHIEEEERIAFPMLRAVLTSQELEEMGRSARAKRLAPEGDVINLAAAERDQAAAPAPKVGLADRGRRLLRRS